jgi:hypothetical protein
MSSSAETPRAQRYSDGARPSSLTGVPADREEAAVHELEDDDGAEEDAEGDPERSEGRELDEREDDLGHQVGHVRDARGVQPGHVTEGAVGCSMRTTVDCHPSRGQVDQTCPIPGG